MEKENVQGLIKKDVEFHEVIYRASKNDKLLQISNNLKEQINRFRIFYLKDYSTPTDILNEHNAIIEAIENGDTEKARVIAENHIKHQEEVIIKAVERMK
jgi:DNA-binding FadR family transcriptional regulator